MKILVCDDDNSSLVKADLLLKKFGYETIALSDASEALRILCTANAPKIAILDWDMPDYNGIEICKRVRKNSTPVSVYIVILTGKDSYENVAEALDAGANDFIRKPFAPVEFRARIAAGVRIVNLEEELKTLTGTIKICSWCKKIHVPEATQWMKIEEYIEQNSYAKFSHGGCPECLEKARHNLRQKT